MFYSDAWDLAGLIGLMVFTMYPFMASDSFLATMLPSDISCGRPDTGYPALDVTVSNPTKFATLTNGNNQLMPPKTVHLAHPLKGGADPQIFTV